MLFPPQTLSVSVAHNPPAAFPAERFTENILALCDMAVLLTQGDQSISYCSKSIFTVLGFDSEEMVSGGWPALYQHIHPQDQLVFEKKLLPALRAYLKKLPPTERNMHTYNYTLRMRHARGHYVLVAIENQPMEWQTGNWPNLYMSVLKNIAPFGNKHKILLIISKQDEHKRHSTVFRQEFDFRWASFSVREVEIIRLVAEGLTSNKIAERLYISPATVNGHRKNILQKSGCTSSSELSAFASLEGML